MTHSAGQQLAKGVLILLMALGSVTLWIGVPIGWLWIGSAVQADSQQTGFGPYLIVIAGIVVSAILLAKGLSGLNAVLSRVTGAEPVLRVRMPWHRSMRGETDSRPPRSVLDVVMVISVSAALLVFTIWFFLFAGSPLPSG